MKHTYCLCGKAYKEHLPLLRLHNPLSIILMRENVQKSALKYTQSYTIMLAGWWQAAVFFGEILPETIKFLYKDELRKINLK